MPVVSSVSSYVARRRTKGVDDLWSSLRQLTPLPTRAGDVVWPPVSRFPIKSVVPVVAECRCGVDPSPGWSGPPCEAPMERSWAGGPSGRALRPECRRLRERPRTSAAVGVARAPSPDA
ncbi:hypothetical protein ISCGN_030650 [Ixodes scapularis]